MPKTREPIPEPATKNCPQRCRTERLAKRGAWQLADRAGLKPTPPVSCDHCDGWHLAPTTTTTGT